MGSQLAGRHYLSVTDFSGDELARVLRTAHEVKQSPSDYADRMVDGVEAGNLSINTLEASLPETPFGGVKSSGYGREGGAEGLHHYTVIKNVSHSMTIV